MKFFVTPCAAILVILAVSGCTSQFKDITVATESNPRVDIAGYETYAWAGAAAIISDPDREWTPPDLDIGAEIQFLIDRELRQHGATEVSANPDLFVAYIAGVDMQALELEDDPESDLEMMKSSPQGALVILLIDAGTGRAVWGALATGEVEGRRSQDEARARLNYAVSQMMARLPTS